MGRQRLLWDEWKDKKTGERMRSCTIITCPANAVIGALHERMPVVLAENLLTVSTSAFARTS